MTTDDLLVDPGDHIDPILVRLIDDDPELPPYVEMQHAGRDECLMVDANRVVDFVMALITVLPPKFARSEYLLVPADDDAEEETAAATSTSVTISVGAFTSLQSAIATVAPDTSARQTYATHTGTNTGTGEITFTIWHPNDVAGGLTFYVNYTIVVYR